MRNLKRAMLAIFFVFSMTAILAWAQDEQPNPEQSPVEEQQASPADQSNQTDPPGRAVRLQYMSGSVSLQPRGTEDWVAGTLNRPLTISDNVWTDKESRAELNVGTGLFRMGDETSLTLTNVSDNAVQVELHQGTLDLHVRHLFGGEIYEIDTPNLAFTIQKSGVYRIDVDPNGDATVVTVRKGEGDATGQGPAVHIRSNQQVRFTDATSMTHTVAEAPPYDGFDDWCAVRDKREDTSLSARYVAPGTVGVEDLDDNGVWREEPPYGHVWVPSSVPAGWAPYQYGHWIWVEPWGWTWVDDAPWGYAPFHYGRWVYTGGYWGWAPGPIYARPVYAPALVAWFGGPGWGVDLGFGVGGGFGWCALGWGEPFYPWYGGGRGYFRNVNISNTRIVNINNYYGHRPNRYGEGGHAYANMRAPGGFTTAPARTLQNGGRVRGTAIRVSGRDLANAPMGRPGIAPTRNAMLGPHAGQRAAAPPARSGMRSVVSRMTPPASFTRHSGSQFGGANSQKPFAGRSGSAPLTPSRIIPHGPESASGAVPSPAMRGGSRAPASNMQRPAVGNSQIGRSANPQVERNVPRPPMNGGAQQARMPQVNTAPSRGGFSSEQRSVPRPPAGFNSRPDTSNMRAQQQSRPNSYGNRPNTAVPRPTGPVRPASQSDRFGNSGNGGYGRQSTASPAYGGGYGNAPRSQSQRPSASPSYRNGGPSNGGSYPSSRSGTPSYGGGSPSYRGASPSYGGGSSPSYRGASPSYGGGSSPSYRGASPSYGGGSPSYRGASPSYGGGSPSYRGASPSYGGGSPSYRGASPSYGGGSPSYRGGSASSYRGGGAPSNSGGGGGGYRSGGGGGGGHASSGGGGGGGHASSGGHGSHR